MSADNGVDDAYAEYVKRKREDGETEKIATLRLPERYMKAVGIVISDSLKVQANDPEEPMPAEFIHVWNSIIRSITASVRDAE